MQVSIESLREFVAFSNRTSKSGWMSPADKLRLRGFSEPSIQALIVMVGFLKLNRENEQIDQLQTSIATIIATILLKTKHMITELYESKSIFTLVVKGIVNMQGREFSESLMASENETLTKMVTDEIEALLCFDPGAIKRFYSYLIATSIIECLKTPEKDGFAGALLLLSSALEIKLPHFLMERLITRTIYHKREEASVVREPATAPGKVWFESELYSTIDALFLDGYGEGSAKKFPCEVTPTPFCADELPNSVSALFGFFNQLSRRKLTFKHKDPDSITVAELSKAMLILRSEMRSLCRDDSGTVSEEDKHALSLEVNRLGRQVGKLRQGVFRRESTSMSFR